MISICVDRAASELDLGARCASPFGRQLEEPDGAVLLPERRAPDVDDVVEPLELDRAVDAQVGPRARRQLAFEDDVDADRAAGRRRVDARDACP